MGEGEIIVLLVLVDDAVIVLVQVGDVASDLLLVVLGVVGVFLELFEIGGVGDVWWSLLL